MAAHVQTAVASQGASSPWSLESSPQSYILPYKPHDFARPQVAGINLPTAVIDEFAQPVFTDVVQHAAAQPAFHAAEAQFRCPGSNRVVASCAALRLTTVLPDSAHSVGRLASKSPDRWRASQQQVQRAASLQTAYQVSCKSSAVNLEVTTGEALLPWSVGDIGVRTTLKTSRAMPVPVHCSVVCKVGALASDVAKHCKATLSSSRLLCSSDESTPPVVVDEASQAVPTTALRVPEGHKNGQPLALRTPMGVVLVPLPFDIKAGDEIPMQIESMPSDHVIRDSGVQDHEFARSEATASPTTSTSISQDSPNPLRLIQYKNALDDIPNYQSASLNDDMCLALESKWSPQVHKTELESPCRDQLVTLCTPLTCNKENSWALEVGDANSRTRKTPTSRSPDRRSCLRDRQRAVPSPKRKAKLRMPVEARMVNEHLGMDEILAPFGASSPSPTKLKRRVRKVRQCATPERVAQSVVQSIVQSPCVATRDAQHCAPSCGAGALPRPAQGAGRLPPPLQEVQKVGAGACSGPMPKQLLSYVDLTPLYARQDVVNGDCQDNESVKHSPSQIQQWYGVDASYMGSSPHTCEMRSLILIQGSSMADAPLTFEPDLGVQQPQPRKLFQSFSGSCSGVSGETTDGSNHGNVEVHEQKAVDEELARKMYFRFGLNKCISFDEFVRLHEPHLRGHARLST